MLDFYKGVDISFLPQEEDAGMTVRDRDGSIMEPFALLKKYGVNAVRLRLWHTPERVPEAKGYCNLSHTIAMAKRVRAAGMRFLLDFHYSDFWADPAKQEKPLAWRNLSGDALERSVCRYTRDTLLEMKREGVMPDIVQIGNEIRSGLLFPDGELPDWDGMIRLVNAGIRGAREAAGDSELQVMIHLDQGGRYVFLHDWFEQAFAHGLMDFDLIGLSYYPFWHGTFADLKETLVRLASEYKKPLMIVETAHAWRLGQDGFIDREQERIAGIAASPEGQRKVLKLVENILASLPGQMGKGFYYWEPLCMPKQGQGGWGYNMGILDQEGRAMEGICAFAFERKDLRGGEIAKVYAPRPVRVRPGEIPRLPETVPVLFFDGHVEERRVVWQESNPLEESRVTGQEQKPLEESGIANQEQVSLAENCGKQIVLGRVEGTEECAYLELIPAKEQEADNLLQDAGWEAGLVYWKTEMEGADAYLTAEFSDPFPAPPIQALCVEAKRNFSFCVSQTLMPDLPGRYCLSVEVEGTDTTGVDVRLFAQHEGGRQEVVIHPQEHGFIQYQISELPYEKGSLTVGIQITAPPMRCKIRSFCLSSVRQCQEDE